MTETPNTAAGSTQENGTTGLADGEGAGTGRQLLHGGTASPADGSATADADHPGLPAGGDPGDTTVGGDLESATGTGVEGAIEPPD